jgi:Mlc titration factor MtfA (ptsG expression regulator)
VRADRPGDRWFALAAAVTMPALVGGVGALVAGWPGALGGLAIGFGFGLVARRALLKRSLGRQALLAEPFPEPWRRFLLESYDHYERMDAAWRRRFEDDVRIFLAEKRISGIEVDVTDELRLLVAASAVTLSVGWPDHEWDELTEVLLYPDDFDRDYSFGGDELSGQTHPEGTVILSAPSLAESFEYPDDAFHVGLHEFAHLLDLDRSHFGGIPAGLGEASAREWTLVAEREMERLRKEGGAPKRPRRRGPDHHSAFDPYGEEDPVEFLAVAVEAFFEIPQRVRRQHAEVYRLLSAYFGQDPAAWDDARGLRE